MTHSDEDLLTTTEGVDEGSAASTAEGPGDGARAEAAGRGAATEPGRAVHGDEESDPAPPSEVASPEIRRTQESGPGQQLAAGEG